MINYNYSKLKGKIKENFDTQVAFAKAIKRSERSVSLKLTGKVPFTQEEISTIQDVLSISDTDLGAYFFDRNVQGA